MNDEDASTELTDAGRLVRAAAASGNEFTRPWSFVPCALEHTPGRVCILPERDCRNRLAAQPPQDDRESDCTCTAYTIRTDYGTGVEHDVDRSSCPVHEPHEPPQDGLQPDEHDRFVAAVDALSTTARIERLGGEERTALLIEAVQSDLRAALAEPNRDAEGDT